MKKINQILTIDSPYLTHLYNISYQPIFILGIHRSGTSILYQMLVSTGIFNYIKAYHIIKYDELLHNYFHNKEEIASEDINTFLKNQGQIDRGMDRLVISSDFPEEYGFIISKKSGQLKLNRKTIQIFEELCKKIQFISNQEKKFLLKNPWDFSNFIYIHSIYPQAKFIFVHRNPANILNSQIKMRRIMLTKENHYFSLLYPQYKQIFQKKILLIYRRLISSPYWPFCPLISIHELKKETDYFLKNIYLLPKRNYINITYEDLCNEPNQVISKIFHHFNLQNNQKINFDIFIKPRQPEITRELKILHKYINKKMRKYISYYTQI